MNSKNNNINFYIIGIGNHPTPILHEKSISIIQETTLFSGGKRHYQLVKSLLPTNHTWIEISGKMQEVINQYNTISEPIVIFASGDPYFYGFGNTLKRYLPNTKVEAYPYFNSIQRLCHKTQTNYNQLQTISVHGRNWSALDTALIQDKPLIGILTDTKKTPAAIAKRLQQYNFHNYKITVGEELDGEKENIHHYTLDECSKKEHASLNCVLLSRTSPKQDHFGIPDAQFVPLANRTNMITKMEIRLSTIHALQLKNKNTFWDIGSCTGSIAIEAKKHYPELEIMAFEKRKECEAIIQKNTEQLSTPGIEIIIDNFFNLDLTQYPIPDVVFIGGHGNRLKEMIHKINSLNLHTRIVINAVTENTTTLFVKELTSLGYTLSQTEIQVNNHNKIKIHTAVKL